jgi:hypothetical protein
MLLHDKTESVFLRERSLEDDAVAGIRLFKDSDNDLIFSDSGSGDNYTEHAQNKKSSQIEWLSQKCAVFYHSGLCGTTRYTLK